MKTFKVTSDPFFRDGEGERCTQKSLKVGDTVEVEDTEPDSVGDVMTEAGNYINMACLVEVGIGGAPARVALVEQAKALLRPDADAHEIVAMATYLEGGAA